MNISKFEVLKSKHERSDIQFPPMTPQVSNFLHCHFEALITVAYLEEITDHECSQGKKG